MASEKTIEELIIKGETQAALNKLLELSINSSNELRNQAVNLVARYRFFENKKINGVLSNEESFRIQNELNVTILELYNSINNPYPLPKSNNLHSFKGIKALSLIFIAVFIVAAFLFFKSQNGGDSTKKNLQNENILIGDNNTVKNETKIENNYMGGEKMKLSKETLEEIAATYVGDKDKVFDKKLIKVTGLEPYFLVSFLEEDEFEIHAVHEINGQWTPFFKERISTSSFKPSLGSFNETQINEDYLIMYECMRWVCGEGFKMLILDKKKKEIFTIYNEGEEFEFSKGVEEIEGVIISKLVEVGRLEKLFYADFFFKELKNRHLPNLVNSFDDKFKNEIISLIPNSDKQLGEIIGIYVENFDNQDGSDFFVLYHFKESYETIGFIVKGELNAYEIYPFKYEIKKPKYVEGNKTLPYGKWENLGLYKSKPVSYIIHEAYQGSANILYSTILYFEDGTLRELKEGETVKEIYNVFSAPDYF